MFNEKYSNLYLRYISLIQKYEKNVIPIHLCLAPIGTNVMLLASEIRVNAKIHCKTVITPGVYNFDVENLQQINQKNKTSHQALPWVMQRFGNHHNDPNPWTIWFEDLNQSDEKTERYQNDLLELEQELWLLREKVEDPYLLELAVCVNYVVRFNEKTRRLFAGHTYAPESGCVAVHIRRGDTWIPKLETGDPGRDCFLLDEYIEQMESFVQKGWTNFYVLSESQQEIDRLKRYFSGRCRIFYQQADRSCFPTLQGTDYDLKEFVEFQCLDNPSLVEFLMHTAVVDIYNASLCDAFIGTFSSQFSALTYLNMVGTKRNQIPVVSLSEGGFYDFLFHPNADNNKEPGLLCIKERNVGLFSFFLQLVNTLLYLEEHRFKLIPYVSLTDNQSYYTGGNTWGEVFEELVPLQEVAIKDDVEAINEHYQTLKHVLDPPNAVGKVFEVRQNVFWTSSFFPKFKGVKWDGFIGCMKIPNDNERKAASRVIGKYIRAKSDIRQQLEDFFAAHFEDHYIIGVQFRGTDARGDFRRKVPKYEDFKNAIQSHIDALAGVNSPIGIFVATDEQAFVTFLGENFLNVYCFETIRLQPGSPYYLEGTDKPSMPTFIDEDPGDALRGVLLDFMGLCRCDIMIHNFGSITNSVLLTNPNLANILVSEESFEFGDQDLRLIPSCNHQLFRTEEDYVLVDARNSNNKTELDWPQALTYLYTDGRTLDSIAKLLAERENIGRKEAFDIAQDTQNELWRSDFLKLATNPRQSGAHRLIRRYHESHHQERYVLKHDSVSALKVELDPSQAVVYALIDGSRNTDEIIKILVDNTGQTTRELGPKVQKTLQMLQDQEFIRWD